MTNDVRMQQAERRQQIAEELRRLRSVAKQPATLNDLGAECHRLATARNKYRTWSYLIGRNAILSEVDEWYAEASYAEYYPNAKAYHHEEYGDILHAVLSVGRQMGYDIDAELAAAMKRNAERAGEAGGECVMRVEEYRYMPDGEPKLTLHLSTPDETATITFEVKIEYELSADNEDWHEAAKMVQAFLQELADEWISNVGKQIVDHAKTLEGNDDE